MARQKPLDKDAAKLQEENEAALRREKHTLAHDVDPFNAGSELLDGSPERKAKQEEAKRGADAEAKQSAKK